MDTRQLAAFVEDCVARAGGPLNVFLAFGTSLPACIATYTVARYVDPAEHSVNDR